jgi:hypothetical protein
VPDGYTPHQQKIIKRYYDNQDAINIQKLAELVTDLYLADGKKRQSLWKRIATAMEKLKVPAQRIQHIVEKNDPELLAALVKELQG